VRTYSEERGNLRKRKDENLPELQWLCRSLLRAAFPVFHDSEIEASFYPYIGMTHTIRRKGSGWLLRISDHCRCAPRPVLEAITMILGSKIMHRKPPRRFLETYEMFRESAEVEESVRERRRIRGRKQIAGVQGKHHSLARIYEEVNECFFNRQIEIRKIGWGRRRGWRRLGHYDPIHHTITISPALDSAKVPEFVIRYIVYHEMLHAVFETASSRAKKRHHTPEFHRAERGFPDFARATTFLREFIGRRRGAIDD
jgi:hypothetical protein